MRVSVRKRTNASPSLREICERGYDGGIGQLKAWLAPLKIVAPEPVVRFETPLGQRMQPTSRSFAAARDPLLALVPRSATAATPARSADRRCRAASKA
jgi:hypothetical protein